MQQNILITLSALCFILGLFPPEPHLMDSFERSKPLESEQGDELQEYLPQVFDNNDHALKLTDW